MQVKGLEGDSKVLRSVVGALNTQLCTAAGTSTQACDTRGNAAAVAETLYGLLPQWLFDEDLKHAARRQLVDNDETVGDARARGDACLAADDVLGAIEAWRLALAKATGEKHGAPTVPNLLVVRGALWGAVRAPPPPPCPRCRAVGLRHQ